MKIYCLIMLALVLFFLAGCNPARTLPLTIARDTEGTNQFRTNGLYYNTYLVESKERTDFIVFYQNGVASGFRAVPGDVDDLVDFLQEKKDINSYGELPIWWGIYNVKGETLNVEKWIANGPGPYSTSVFKATILNDTTLDFNVSAYGRMQFYPLENKPDSTNAFIK